MSLEFSTSCCPDLMMELTLAVLLCNLLLLVVSLVNALRPFFKPSLIVYLVTLYVTVSVLPTLVAPQPPTLTTSVAYTCTTLFVACSLWDSRQFIRDTFKYASIVLTRPHYVCLPVTIILAATHTFPTDGISLSLPLVGIQAMLAIVGSEAVYSVSKRKEWLIRTRRESIPRVVSNIVTPTFNQTRIQFR